MVNKAEANNCFSMHCNPKLSNYVVNSVNKENIVHIFIYYCGDYSYQDR